MLKILQNRIHQGASTTTN